MLLLLHLVSRAINSKKALQQSFEEAACQERGFKPKVSLRAFSAVAVSSLLTQLEE